MISVHRKAGMANSRLSGAFEQSVVLIECLARNYTADRIYAVAAVCELLNENKRCTDPSLSRWETVADAQTATENSCGKNRSETHHLCVFTNRLSLAKLLGDGAHVH